MSNVHGNEFLLNPYARKLIRFKARQLCKRQDFQSTELDDLQQHLWLALIKAGEQFDPAKASLNTFIDRVVNTAVGMLLRSRRRLKRGNGLHPQSLNSEFPTIDEAPETLAEAVSYDDLSRRTGAVSLDETAHREDCEAIEHALNAMPKELQELCQQLMAGTVASAARGLRASRRQTRNLIDRAKSHFEREGFDF